MDVHEIATDPGLTASQRTNANTIVQATALLVDDSVITCDTSTCTLTLDTPSFNGTPLCSDQVPGQQAVQPPDPLVEDGRRCSAFLVGPNVMVTSGVCFSRRELGFPFDCADAKIVFGWQTDSSGSANATVPVANVYSCQAIVNQSVYGTANIVLPEYAIFTLDRPVTGRTPVTTRATGVVSSMANLGVAGFPLALPMKVADDAAVVVNSDANFFRATVDIETGQSGSPVFDLDTGVVEGFVRTLLDPRFVTRPAQGSDPECFEFRQCDTAGSCDESLEGIGIQRITRVPLPVIPAPSDMDSDGDSFPDSWETNGVLGGAPIDLPALGANAMHKDLFLHVDWMERPAEGLLPAVSFRPNQRVIDMLVEAFADGSVWNPDGEPGVTLHVDTGSADTNKVTYTQFMGADPNAMPLVTPNGTNAARVLTQSATYMGRAGGYIASNRGNVFHYVLMGDTMQPDRDEDVTVATGFPNAVATGIFTIDITAISGTELTIDQDGHATYFGDRIFQGGATTRVVEIVNPDVCGRAYISGCRVRVQSVSGLSIGAALRDNGGRDDGTIGTTGSTPGRYFIVTVGAAEDEVRHAVGSGGDDMLRASTIMHELGHNLGLQHGGNQAGGFERKPNYVSITGYAYSGGLVGADGMTFIDYSRFELPSLDETTLNEEVGIQHPQGVHAAWYCAWPYPKLFTHEGAGAVMYDEFGGVNWDCSNVNTTVFPYTQPMGEVPNPAASASINRNTAATDVHTSFNDWPNIDLASAGLIGNSEIDEVEAGPTDDPRGEEFDSTTLERFQLPLPAFTTSTTSPSGLAPLTVNFDAAGSRDLQSVVTAYKWNFGDGSELVTAISNVVHVYTQPGVYVATLIVSDDDNNDSNYFSRERIRVKGLPAGCSVDSVAPIITAPNQTVTRCLPVPAPTPLAVSTTDASCPGNAHINLAGRVVTVNGEPYDALINPQTGGIAPILPLGVIEVQWTARDVNGNQRQQLQTVTVNVNDESSTLCCASGQTVSQGTAWPDLRWFPLTGGYCVFGNGSVDTITTGPGADYLSGGSSGDYLNASGASSTVTGGTGNDTIDMSGGDSRAYGGAGNDSIDIVGGGLAYGGAGDDAVTAFFGSHRIYPGPGRDNVLAGSSDDEVFIYDVCEVQPLEWLDGGLGGHDVLHTPVPLTELLARGAIVIGFEEIVINPQLRYLSEGL